MRGKGSQERGEAKEGEDRKEKRRRRRHEEGASEVGEWRAGLAVALQADNKALAGRGTQVQQLCSSSSIAAALGSIIDCPKPCSRLPPADAPMAPAEAEGSEARSEARGRRQDKGRRAPQRPNFGAASGRPGEGEARKGEGCAGGLLRGREEEEREVGHCCL